MAAFHLQSRSAPVSGEEKSVRVAAASKNQVSSQVKQSNDVVNVADSNKVTSEKSAASKSAITTASDNSSPSAGTVSHVVISYNQHGKLRTKFVDSRNNVVYQIPSEMVTKLEDQMLTSNSSTNVKA